MTPLGPEERGQVLVLFAIIITILLAFAAFRIDIGRQVAERRHIQTAADAGALAACRALVAGDTDAVAAQAASEVALANLEGSPAGGAATIASPSAFARFPPIRRTRPPSGPSTRSSGESSASRWRPAS